MTLEDCDIPDWHANSSYSPGSGICVLGSSWPAKLDNCTESKKGPSWAWVDGIHTKKAQVAQNSAPEAITLRSNLYEFAGVALGSVLEKSGLLGHIFWHWVPLKNIGGLGVVAPEKLWGWRSRIKASGLPWSHFVSLSPSQGHPSLVGNPTTTLARQHLAIGSYLLLPLILINPMSSYFWTPMSRQAHPILLQVDSQQSAAIMSGNPGPSAGDKRSLRDMVQALSVHVTWNSNVSPPAGHTTPRKLGKHRRLLKVASTLRLRPPGAEARVQRVEGCHLLLEYNPFNLNGMDMRMLEGALPSGSLIEVNPEAPLAQSPLLPDDTAEFYSPMDLDPQDVDIPISNIIHENSDQLFTIAFYIQTSGKLLLTEEFGAALGIAPFLYIAFLSHSACMERAMAMPR
ncbi:hypothetical protein BS47DRAFT_1369183 [Hydnum rufescens UP504]|uniref:Uncharacterized protein n=1 Tax=Hydnum rufescens UP504 TaxID=1448309 RepID=A0A9P6AEX2_9AGAM|nr:hypothetical protein BS47DRAFT_1369183 [Hydnum rufescens UP504]